MRSYARWRPTAESDAGMAPHRGACSEISSTRTCFSKRSWWRRGPNTSVSTSVSRAAMATSRQMCDVTSKANPLWNISLEPMRSRRPHASRRALLCRCDVPRVDRLDGVFKGLRQHTLPDGPHHEAKYPSFEVLAVSYDDGVELGPSV